MDDLRLRHIIYEYYTYILYRNIHPNLQEKEDGGRETGNRGQMAEGGEQRAEGREQRAIIN